jgi:hypothetical protein
MVHWLPGDDYSAAVVRDIVSLGENMIVEHDRDSGRASDNLDNPCGSRGAVISGWL